jgi:hypothetical protein
MNRIRNSGGSAPGGYCFAPNPRSHYNLAVLNQNNQEIRRMSAPSRRPEIRRRRIRREKILKLRKRHAAASSDQDRTRLAGKLHRLGLNSPGQALLKA